MYHTICNIILSSLLFVAGTTASMATLTDGNKTDSTGPIQNAPQAPTFVTGLAETLQRLVMSACDHHDVTGSWPAHSLSSVDNIAYPEFAITDHNDNGFTARFSLAELELAWVLTIEGLNNSRGCQNARLTIQALSLDDVELIKLQTSGNLNETNSGKLNYLLVNQAGAIGGALSEEDKLKLGMVDNSEAIKQGGAILYVILRIALCVLAATAGASSC